MTNLQFRFFWTCFLIIFLSIGGNLHAQGDNYYKEGMALKAKGSNTEALELLIQAGNTGHTEAQFQIGMMYFQGLGVPQKFYGKAVEWWEKAAAKGHKIAQYNIGVSWENGAHDTQNYANAAHYYQLSVDQGYSPACYALGVLYLNGRGVKKDIKAARQLFEKVLAENGSTNIKNNAKKLLASISTNEEEQIIHADKTVAESTNYAETASAKKEVKIEKEDTKVAESAPIQEISKKPELDQTSPDVIKNDNVMSKVTDIEDMPKSVSILIYGLMALSTLIGIYLFILSCIHGRKAFFLLVLFILATSMFFMPTAIAIVCTYWMFYVKSIKNSVIKTLNIIIPVLVYFPLVYVIAKDQNIISSIVIGISSLVGGIYFFAVIEEHISMNRCPHCRYYHHPILINKELIGTDISRRGVSRDECVGQRSETTTGYLSDGTPVDVRVNIKDIERQKGVEKTTTSHYLYTLRCKNKECKEEFRAETTRAKVSTKWN